MSGERRPERAAASWLLARRYPDAPTALAAYEAVRDLLLAADLDACVLRLTVNGLSFVAVLGEQPLARDATARLGLALGHGIEATLPGEVGAQLRERRRAFKRTGIEFTERRSGL